MVKTSPSLRPQVQDGLEVLGNLVREARLGRKWTRDDLARRAAVSIPTIAKIESGSPGTAVGTVFNVADLVGVPIFGIEDRGELARLRRLGEEKLTLLPSRIRTSQNGELSDDF